MPSISSRFSGLASYSAGSGLTGRRLANRPSPLRSPSRPCSGRGFGGVGRVPLRAPDRRQQHRVGAAAGVERLVGQRDAVSVDRGAAEQVLLELEVGPTAREHLDRRGDDLRADPVAGEQNDDAATALMPCLRGSMFSRT